MTMMVLHVIYVIYVGYDDVDCDYGDDDDGYWITDAWHRVVWFVDHPV